MIKHNIKFSLTIINSKLMYIIILFDGIPIDIQKSIFLKNEKSDLLKNAFSHIIVYFRFF
ncbi:hypothetical protein LSO9J_10054 [Candidatus Liberibacter solanacearum]